MKKQMKILISSEQMYPFTGGGAYISIFTLANELAKEHEVHAVYIGESFDSKISIYPQKIKLPKGVWPKYYFLAKKWKKIIEEKVRRIKPDVIITQESVTPPTIKVAKKYNIPVIAFIRSYMHMCIDGFKNTPPEKCAKNCLFCKTGLKYKLQYPFFRAVRKQQVNALKNANLVLPVSYYVKALTKQWYNIDSEVIRPFIDIKKYELAKAIPKGDCIALINPDVHKGLNIFLEIAKNMPDRKFLVAGKKIQGYQNIASLEWTDNMKEVYRKTRLLLVPSIWPDPCPRVAIEAMASGIPCIGTNIGGFPEEVENAGIVIKNMQSMAEWISAVKKFDDMSYYSEMSKKAKQQSEKFDFKIQYQNFKKLLIALNKPK